MTSAGGSNYDYDLNGNVTIRNKGLSSQQTLTWNAENHLASISGNGLTEWYLYNPEGQRVKKIVNTTTPTFYPFAHYEVDNGVIVKYYFFGGQRVAMKRGSTLTYLHGDHLSSTALSTTSSGAFDVGQGYRGYGNYRTGGALPTEHRFTGQKLDPTGLMYYNARYYDRAIGHFISPDTLVPDPTTVWDYNRFAYARLNPLKYNDPTGHCATLENGAPDLANDGGCWDAANEYLATFGIGGYESEEQWRQYFASNTSITEETLRASLYAHWSPLYRQWSVYHTHYNPPPQWHTAPPPPSVVEDMKAIHYTLLYQCAVVMKGACGVSYGGTAVVPGAATRMSGDFYVDQNGDIALYGTLGGGPAVMLLPQPMGSHGMGAVAVPNATVHDVGGFSLQIGASGALGKGVAVDLVVAVSETAPTGVMLGSAYGPWNAEAHAIIAYSFPLYSSGSGR